MNFSPYGLCEREIVGRPALRPRERVWVWGWLRAIPVGGGVLDAPRRGQDPSLRCKPVTGGDAGLRAGHARPLRGGGWLIGCWPGGAGGIYAAPCGQAYCNIRIPDKHHSISKEVLLAPLSFFVVSCYNILCIVMYKIYRERYLFITYAAFEKL